MSHDDAAKAQSHSKLVIRNIGLLLSGNMGRPILDADTNRGNRRPNRSNREDKGRRARSREEKFTCCQPEAVSAVIDTYLQESVLQKYALVRVKCNQSAEERKSLVALRVRRT